MNNNKQYGYLLEYDSLKKINVENNIYTNNTSSMLYNSSHSISLVNNRYKTENLNYLEFKKRFIQSLRENDKNNKKYKEQKITKFSQKNNDNINKELKKSITNVNDIFDERG